METGLTHFLEATEITDTAGVRGEVPQLRGRKFKVLFFLPGGIDSRSVNSLQPSVASSAITLPSHQKVLYPWPSKNVELT